jgi:hypothetical protein
MKTWAGGPKLKIELLVRHPIAAIVTMLVDPLEAYGWKDHIHLNTFKKYLEENGCMVTFSLLIAAMICAMNSSQSFKTSLSRSLKKTSTSIFARVFFIFALFLRCFTNIFSRLEV